MLFPRLQVPYWLLQVRASLPWLYELSPLALNGRICIAWRLDDQQFGCHTLPGIFEVVHMEKKIPKGYLHCPRGSFNSYLPLSNYQSGLIQQQALRPKTLLVDHPTIIAAHPATMAGTFTQIAITSSTAASSGSFPLPSGWIVSPSVVSSTPQITSTSSP